MNVLAALKLLSTNNGEAKLKKCMDDAKVEGEGEGEGEEEGERERER